MLGLSEDFHHVVHAAEVASYKKIQASLAVRPSGSKVARPDHILYSGYDHLNIALDKLVMLQLCLDQPELRPYLVPKILAKRTDAATGSKVLDIFEFQRSGIARAAQRLQQKAALSTEEEAQLRETLRKAIITRLQFAARFPSQFRIGFKGAADAAQKYGHLMDIPHTRYFERLSHAFKGIVINEGGVEIDGISLSVTTVETAQEMLDAQQAVKQYKIDHGIESIEDIVGFGPRVLN